MRSSPTISRPAVAAWLSASSIWDRRSGPRSASLSAHRSQRLFSWRDAFLAIGVIGLVVALVTPFVVKEPRRGALDAARRPAGRREGAVLGHGEDVLLEPGLMLAAFGSGVTQFVTYGLGNFAVLFLMREKGMR